jgi:DNA-directed RNA polymerase subunit L
MELNLIEKDKKMMEIEVIGEDATLLNPLLEALLADPKVEMATYRKEHPIMGNHRLKVQVKDGKPQTALKRAAKAVEKEFQESQEILEKMLNA